MARERERLSSSSQRQQLARGTLLSCFVLFCSICGPNVYCQVCEASCLWFVAGHSEHRCACCGSIEPIVSCVWVCVRAIGKFIVPNPFFIVHFRIRTYSQQSKRVVVACRATSTNANHQYYPRRTISSTREAKQGTHASPGLRAFGLGAKSWYLESPFGTPIAQPSAASVLNSGLQYRSWSARSRASSVNNSEL